MVRLKECLQTNELLHSDLPPNVRYSNKRPSSFDDEHQSGERASKIASVPKSLCELLGELQQAWNLGSGTSILDTILSIAGQIGVEDQVNAIPIAIKKLQFLADQTGLSTSK